MLRVRASRTFNGHRAGDELLVEETVEVKQLVYAKLFEIVAVESVGEPDPVAVEELAQIEDEAHDEGEEPAALSPKKQQVVNIKPSQPKKKTSDV